ncbi:MAG: protein kinase [Aphanothece sp. CMT-3BRIN-NPC111]|jgi:serine/threonine-protein kinase|nr:protein kinase [Aphanothece sp. CMT-3BRIN-NPC111]
MLGRKLRQRYTLIKLLGIRRFGDTYLAKDEDLPGKPLCIVKQFKPKHRDRLVWYAARQLFSLEAAVLYRLGRHNQIPQLFAQFQENNELYLVQEFINGKELSQELTPGKRWSEKYVVALLQDILEILAFIHHNKIVHRDIKPSNLIRRSQDNKIVVIDFGAVQKISDPLVNDQEQTSFMIAIGTRGYMPSEQASGNPKFNSDIYALGIIGIQALTGIFPPPQDTDSNEIIWRNQVEVSPKLADILDKMVRYDFRQRYQSAVEVLEALHRLASPQLPVLVKNRPRGQEISRIGILVAFIACITTIVGVQEFSKSFDSNESKKISFQQKAEIANKFLSYENTNDKIKIKYPDNWEIQDIENPVTGEVVAFLPPKETDLDTFREMVGIRIEYLSNQSMSLKEYTNSSISEIKQFIKDAKIVNSRSTTLANRPAHMVVYTKKDEQDRLIASMELWTLNKNKAYIINYTAETSNYDNFLKSSEQMIKFFEIL